MAKYFIKGIGEISLTEKDYIAEGGFGKVFGKNNVAYKIYQDPTNMLPITKINELSVLTHKNIIKPDSVILNAKNVPVGYTMKMVDGIPLCQLFTKAFKNRNNITNNDIIHLIKHLYEQIKHVHDQGILAVDINEFNFLVSKKFDEVYSIDVDSYQTKNYPATAIMPSVYDHSCNKNFTTNSDWFSWGIITFQMLIGIHPYKGNHPNFEKIPIGQRLESRMKQNVSVFNKDVSMPKCEPFTIIPKELMKWYKAVFEDGKRLEPPKDFNEIVHVVKIDKVQSSNSFIINKVITFNKDITNYYSYNGNTIVQTQKTAHFNNKEYNLPANNVEFIFTSKGNSPFAVYVDRGSLRIFDIINQIEQDLQVSATDITNVNGNIYIKSGTSILMLSIIESKNTVFSTKKIGNVLDVPNASKMYENVLIQNLLGRQYISIFSTVGTSGACYQIGVPELDGYSIVNAKYKNNVLVVIAVNRKTNEYNRFLFRFSDNYSKYECLIKKNVASYDINFTVNDVGVCVLINDEENIEVFSNQKEALIKEINDPSINSDMILCNDGNKIMFIKGNELYSMSMKK